MVTSHDVERITPPRRVGERWEYIDLVFWPENGLIYIEDQADGDFTAVMRPDWVARIITFQRQNKRLRDVIERTGNIARRDTLVAEWHATEGLIEAMVEVNRRAKSQGDPTDPAVLEHYQKHKSDKVTRIVVPGDVQKRAKPQKLIIPGK